MEYNLKCKFCKTQFKYKLTLEKKQVLLDGYSIDIKCPNPKCFIGLATAKSFGLIKK